MKKPDDVDSEDSDDVSYEEEGEELVTEAENDGTAVSDLNHIAQMIEDCAQPTIDFMHPKMKVELSIRTGNKESMEDASGRIDEEQGSITEEEKSSSSGSDTSEDELVSTLGAQLRAMEGNAEEEEEATEAVRPGKSRRERTARPSFFMPTIDDNVITFYFSLLTSLAGN